MAETYVGDFKLGKWHGKGDLHRANGAHYVGDFVEARYEGHGDPDLYRWGRVHR
jgi:hypothetical protein